MPLWWSFGTVGREGTYIPATLSRALSRPRLVYPLVSLDISGQWPVFHTDASPNEVSVCGCAYITGKSQSQEMTCESYTIHIFPSTINLQCVIRIFVHTSNLLVFIGNFFSTRKSRHLCRNHQPDSHGEKHLLTPANLPDLCIALWRYILLLSDATR